MHHDTGIMEVQINEDDEFSQSQLLLAIPRLSEHVFAYLAASQSCTHILATSTVERPLSLHIPPLHSTTLHLLSQVLRTKRIIQISTRILPNMKRRAIILIQHQLIRNAKRQIRVRQVMSPKRNDDTRIRMALQRGFSGFGREAARENHCPCTRHQRRRSWTPALQDGTQSLARHWLFSRVW